MIPLVFIIILFYSLYSDLFFFSANTRGGLVIGLRVPFLLFVECLNIRPRGGQLSGNFVTSKMGRWGCQAMFRQSTS
jgi:hypothetical protein